MTSIQYRTFLRTAREGQSLVSFPSMHAEIFGIIRPLMKLENKLATPLSMFSLKHHFNCKDDLGMLEDASGSGSSSLQLIF